MLQNNAIIKSYIDKLWNSFWSGGIANPLTAIEQITYLIFMKRLDDIETKRERDAEFTGEKYMSRFHGNFIPPGMKKENAVDKRELRWNIFKHYPADQLLLHIQTKVFPFLKELNGTTSPFTKHMANAVFIMPKASLLVEAIKTIDTLFLEIEKDATDGGHSFQDIQGDVYEMLLSEIATAGKNGQFRTPRHIIKLMAELVEPQLGQRIADPACGTSGFLLGAYQYMLTQMVMKENHDKVLPDKDGFYRATLSAMMNEKVKGIIETSLFGFDVDTTMVRLGLMNLMMHGIDEPKVDYKDTLSKTYKEEGLYQVIMANPPFTGNIDKGDINEDLKLPTTKTELLFVERIYNMLAIGGTAAVILLQIDHYYSKYTWFEIVKRKFIIGKEEREATEYKKTTKSLAYQKYFATYFSMEEATINKLIELFRKTKTDIVEIVATLYYTWKDMIVQQTVINKNNFVAGFYQFHPDKKNLLKSKCWRDIVL